MTKFIGALLLIAAGAGMGVAKTRQLHFRVRSLSSILGSLEIMRGEICTRLTPLPELFLQLAAEAPGPADEFFSALKTGLTGLGERSLGEIWYQALEDTPSLVLKPEEERALYLFGMSLGRFDVAEQKQAIDRCMESMGRFLETARGEAQARGRLYTGLGLALGMMLAVVLL
ncbi:MAG TPA: stage III sporulation protein AB [Clostridiales bacterium]|nr:stage III sporulation protein AB [Clostridiales bacterium]